MISVEELVDRLDTFQSRVEKECVEIAKHGTPVGVTGNLRASTKVLSRVEGRSSFIGPDVSYAEDVVNGSDRHARFRAYRGNRFSIHRPIDSDWSILEPGWEYNRGHPANNYIPAIAEDIKSIVFEI